MPWALPQGRKALFDLATGYPYPAPEKSYLFRNGELRAIERAEFSDRAPVIAFGSNRSPEQLQRKFGHLPAEGSEIPVTFAWVDDYDVVYAAHVTRYGALAATMAHVPKCRVRIAITWLNAQQLERMHETEGSHYAYGRLEDVNIALEAGPGDRIDRAWLYLSRFGSLAHEGRHLGLAALAARDRPHPALDQRQALELLRRTYRPEQELEAFVLSNIGDRNQDRRLALIRAIRESALPMTAPHFKVELEETPGPV